MKRIPVFSKFLGLALLTLFMVMPLVAQEDITYQMPPKEIADLVDTPRNPGLMISPDSKFALVVEIPSLPSIKELAQPELKLAGLRINPATNGPSALGTTYFKKIKIKNLSTLNEIPITGLPEDAQITDMTFSPDSQKVAFANTRENGIELWCVNVADGKAVKLTEPILNSVSGSAFEWLSDSKRLVCLSILKDRPKAPVKDLTPKGPVVQSNEGKVSPVRTFPDMLTCKYDEELFIYYGTSQMMIVDINGQQKNVGKPGLIEYVNPSPNAAYFMVSIVKQPFSYIYPAEMFPHSYEIWDIEGNFVKQLFDMPMMDYLPISNDAAPRGPRNFSWRADAPAVLYWAETQDNSDPTKEVEFRDKIFFLEAPFTGQPKEGPGTKYRYYGIQWGNGKMAFIRQGWWKTRKNRTDLFQPDSPATPTKVIFDLSSEDRYSDPGRFISTLNQYGRSVLLTVDNGKSLMLMGRGSSPEGDRPFIDKYSLETGKIIRLWRSEAPYYENPMAVIDPVKQLVITSREGAKIQPNYYIRDLKSKKLKQITFFPHPYPALKDVEKQLIKYKRPDGVELSGNLYLPVGYKKTDGPLPVLMWAYPAEFKTKSAAGQVSDSPYRFIRISWASPILWLTRGYAIFDNPAMPIIGEGKQEPNDTYIEQLVADAQAAIDKLVEMGVGDKNRMSIGGHSYGAFMTANLLAHSRLFAAGVARSGAYNRTLTPFGFQAEERDLWQAPDTYVKMSPFMYADKVQDALLLIHGQNDNNTGTFPIQSERFFQALKGKGATTRLVMLPFESHGYYARESIMHVLWETDTWLEKYVKNKK